MKAVYGEDLLVDQLAIVLFACFGRKMVQSALPGQIALHGNAK